MSRAPRKLSADAHDQMLPGADRVTEERFERFDAQATAALGEKPRTGWHKPIPAHELTSQEQLCSGQYSEPDFDYGDAA